MTIVGEEMTIIRKDIRKVGINMAATTEDKVYMINKAVVAIITINIVTT